MAGKKEKLIFQVGIEDNDELEKAKKTLNELTIAAAKQKKEKIKATDAERDAIKIAKLQVKAAKAQEGSYDQLSAQYRINRKSINGLSADYLENTAEGKNLIKETAKLRTGMNESQQATKNFSLEVGNYRDQWKQATTAQQKFSLVGKKGLNAFKKVGKSAFKAVGGAIKGMGLGLLIGLVGTLFEALKKNQKVMDLFEQAVNAVSAVITPIADGISKLVTGLASGSSEFDAFGRVIKNVMTIALTPLKLTFFGIIKLVTSLQIGWMKAKAIFGKDIDTKQLEKLNTRLKETDKKMQDAKDSATDAYKGIGKDAKEAFNEIKDFGKGVAEEVKKAVNNISHETLQASVEAKKMVERLETARDVAHKQGMYDAEELRQIRDDTTTSIDAQIKANKDLAIQLEKQRQDEISIVNQQIEQQKKVLAVNKNNEEAKARMARLKYELIDIDEDIIGMMAEQQAAGLALDREKIDIDKAAIERKKQNEKELSDYLKEAAANTELEKLKLAEEAEILENEKRVQAIADDIELTTTSEEEKTALLAKLETARQKELNKIKGDYAKKEEKIIEKKAAIEEDAAEKTKQIQIDANKAKLENTASILSSASSLMKEAFGENKAAAIAGVAMDAAAAIISTWSGYAKMGPIGTIGAVLQTATIGAAAVKSTKDIKSQSFAGGGIVSGNSLSGDKISANVNSQEMILTKSQQAQLFAQANGGGGGGVDSNAIAQAVIDAIKGIEVTITEQNITEKQKEVRLRESKFKI